RPRPPLFTPFPYTTLFRSLFIKKAASHRSVSPDDKLSVQVWKLFLRFRKTVWFRITYLVLLGLIVPNLLPFSAGGLGCLVIILVDRKSTRLNSSHVSISYA